MTIADGEARARTWFWALLAVATALRVLLAIFVPLSGDEAYYWDCSRHPDWSYFDQPPLVIWAMIPLRALFGETALAIRMPAVLASLAVGLCLPPLMRRLGGGYREALHAYLWMCAMPLFLIGSFYASTDVAMGALFVAATWAAVAIAQGERRAWWGFGAALGLGFLAKFPGVVAIAALLPALQNAEVRRQLRTPTPWLAALLAIAITLPVWIWGARHNWDNIGFQLQDRQHVEALSLRHLATFLTASLLLASPPLFMAMLLTWRRGLLRPELGWKVVAFATAAPFVFFGIVSLRTSVGAHWGGPGLLLGAILLALTPALRPRRALAWSAGGFGGLVTAFILVVVLFPAQLARVDWTNLSPLDRIPTQVIYPMLGDPEVVREIERRRRDEMLVSESYTTVHLFTFLSQGRLSFRLADVNAGEHGLSSLYWHPASDFVGRDVLFVTRNPWLKMEKIEPWFAHVEELAPIDIRRDGKLIRHYRVFRGTDLRNVTPAFSRVDHPPP
jgi:4-amino-4-deoxy-L-arabinose transferase-like glycosyltransferase